MKSFMYYYYDNIHMQWEQLNHYVFHTYEHYFLQYLICL